MEERTENLQKRMNQTKMVFLEKMSRIDKSARPIKGKSERIQINKTINKKWDFTADTIETERTIRGNYQTNWAT